MTNPQLDGQRRRFQMVDVFSPRPFGGNPVAVVLDGEGLGPADMLAIARWLNLSETAFIVPVRDPAADYRVRIFTLAREMPFAGHPTLGACHAWLADGHAPRDPSRVVQECGAGLVPVSRTDSALSFEAPPLVRDGNISTSDLKWICSFLRLDHNDVVDARWIDNGPGWAGVLLPNAGAVLAIDPVAQWPARADIGVIGPHGPGHRTKFEARAFYTDHHGQVREDPVTGSLNASAAAWMLETDRARAPFSVSQGTRVGRSGVVSITQSSDGRVWVGGATTTVVHGTINAADLSSGDRK